MSACCSRGSVKRPDRAATICPIITELAKGDQRDDGVESEVVLTESADPLQIRIPLGKEIEVG